MTDRLCEFPGCGNIHRTTGLCQAHNYQRSQGQELRPLRYRTPKNKGCKVAGCARLHYALGFCQLDYVRNRRGTPISTL